MGATDRSVARAAGKGGGWKAPEDAAGCRAASDLAQGSSHRAVVWRALDVESEAVLPGLVLHRPGLHPQEIDAATCERLQDAMQAARPMFELDDQGGLVARSCRFAAGEDEARQVMGDVLHVAPQEMTAVQSRRTPAAESRTETVTGGADVAD